MWWDTIFLQASNVVYLGVNPVEEEDDTSEDYSGPDIGEFHWYQRTHVLKIVLKNLA